MKEFIAGLLGFLVILAVIASGFWLLFLAVGVLYWLIQVLVKRFCKDCTYEGKQAIRIIKCLCLPNGRIPQPNYRYLPRHRKLMGACLAIGDRGIVGRAAKARTGIKEFLSVCLRLIVLESGIPQ